VAVAAGGVGLPDLDRRLARHVANVMLQKHNVDGPRRLWE
jgi:hypothetical protein